MAGSELGGTDACHHLAARIPTANLDTFCPAAQERLET
jgi:hypothetical protein